MKKIRLRIPELAKEKAHREGRSITKYVIHKEADLAFNTVDAYWENTIQSMNIDVLVKLCDYLDCSLHDLLVEEDDEKIAVPA